MKTCKRLSVSEISCLWEELLMKFLPQIKGVSVRRDASQVIFKLHQVPKPIRDQMILRRFSSMAGVQVGFHKPRRESAAQKRMSESERPYYTVYITVRFPLGVRAHFDGPEKYNRTWRVSDYTPQEFEKWLDYARTAYDESSTSSK